VLKSCSDSVDQETLKNNFISSIKDAGLKNGQVLWPIRVSLSGEEFSPGAFEMIHIY
jgi:glutamyl-tRNA synthetase